MVGLSEREMIPLMLRRGADVVTGRLLRPLSSVLNPRAVSYAVTWRCNCSCHVCSNRDIPPSMKKSSHEIGWREMERAFSDRALKTIDLIRFTGGEPFLKGDLIDIIKAIHSNAGVGIFYITSNGSYPERAVRLVEDLIPCGVNLSIQVSIDAIGRLHDELRRHKGLFEKARNTLVKLKEMTSDLPLRLGINQTIQGKNLHAFGEVHDLAMELGVAHHVYLAYKEHESGIPLGSLHSGPSPFGLKEDMPLDDVRSLIEWLMGESSLEKSAFVQGDRRAELVMGDRLWGLLSKYLWEGDLNRIVEKKAYPNPKCMAGFRYFRINPNGDIIPCTLRPKVMGNIGHQRFSAIWKGRRARSVRDEIRGCPGCWVECDILPSAIYSGDFVKWYLRKKFMVHGS